MRPALSVGRGPTTIEGIAVNAAAIVPAQEPIGIIIHDGGERRKPAAIWAYMWAADEDETTEHWHEQMPVDHAA